MACSAGNRKASLMRGTAGDNLPLRNLVDGVDMVHAFTARFIALMDGIDPQESRLPLGIGPTPLADGHLRCSGLGVVPTLLAVLGALAQVIQMGHGNRRQTFVVALAVDLVFPFQNVPCRRPAEGFMRLVDSGQQFHVPRGITLGKAMSLVYRRLDPAGFAKAGDQPGYLGPAQPRHLLHVLPQQAPRRDAPAGNTGGGPRASRSSCRSVPWPYLRTGFPRSLSGTPGSGPDSTARLHAR